MSPSFNARKAVFLPPLILALLAPGCAGHGVTPPRDFLIEGRMGLAAFMALSDGHLQQIAADFEMLSATDDVQSADWLRIRGPVAQVAQRNVAALTWFALPDGSYWTVQQGKAAGNLSDRSYWPRLMAGQPVVGDLVASRATGKSSAIVAVPVLDAQERVVGALGSSVYLDSLSLRLKRELDLQPDLIFYSIDATPLGALQEDPSQIFLDPYELGEPDLERAIREMLTKEEGVVNYRFRGVSRTVLYRKSHVSGWWYAFGHVWH